MGRKRQGKKRDSRRTVGPEEGAQHIRLRFLKTGKGAADEGRTGKQQRGGSGCGDWGKTSWSVIGGLGHKEQKDSTGHKGENTMLKALNNREERERCGRASWGGWQNGGPGKKENGLGKVERGSTGQKHKRPQRHSRSRGGGCGRQFARKKRARAKTSGGKGGRNLRVHKPQRQGGADDFLFGDSWGLGVRSIGKGSSDGACGTMVFGGGRGEARGQKALRDYHSGNTKSSAASEKRTRQII